MSILNLVSNPSLKLDKRCLSLIQKASQKYRLRLGNDNDRDSIIKIFSECMLGYVGIWGNDLRKDITIRSNVKIEPFSTLAPDASTPERITENESDSYVMPEQYRRGFIDYVDYAAQDVCMNEIDDYWNILNRSCFVIAEDIQTKEVVGTLAIQSVEDMGCSYSRWVGDVINKYSLTSNKNLEEFALRHTVDQYKQYWDLQFEPQIDRFDGTVYSPARTEATKNIITQDIVDSIYSRYHHQLKKETIKSDEAAAKIDMSSPLSTTSTTSSVDDIFNHNSNYPIVDDLYVNPRLTEVDIQELTKYLQQDPAIKIHDDIDYSKVQSLFNGKDRYRECEFRRVNVSSQCRGSGVAQLLIFGALELSANVFQYEAVHLTTSNAMNSAMYYYRKCAFREEYFSYQFECDIHWPESHFRWALTPFSTIANPLRDTISNPTFK